MLRLIAAIIIGYIAIALTVFIGLSSAPLPVNWARFWLS